MSLIKRSVPSSSIGAVLLSFSKAPPHANVLRLMIAAYDSETPDIDTVRARADTALFKMSCAFSNIDRVAIETGTADAGRAQQFPPV